MLAALLEMSPLPFIARKFDGCYVHHVLANCFGVCAMIVHPQACQVVTYLPTCLLAAYLAYLLVFLRLLGLGCSFACHPTA